MSWVIRPEVPEVPFKIAAGIAAAAAALRLDVEHDFGAASFGPGIVGASILDKEVANLCFGTADILGLSHQLIGFLDRTEHDRAVAKAKFSVVDGPVRGGQHPPLFETKRDTKPVNGGPYVAISQCWSDRPANAMLAGHHGGLLNSGLHAFARNRDWPGVVELFDAVGLKSATDSKTMALNLGD